MSSSRGAIWNRANFWTKSSDVAYLRESISKVAYLREGSIKVGFMRCWTRHHQSYPA